MPNIKVYESNTSPRVGVPAAPRVPVVDNGLRALGAGFSRLGEAVEKRKIEQDDTAAVTAAAELKEKLAERRRQAILDGTAAEPEWMDREREFAQTELETVTGNLQTEHGKRRAQERNAVLLAEETNRWIATQSTVAANVQKNQLQSVEDITLRAIQQDPSGHAAAVESFLEDLEGPAYAQLPKDVKEDYARNFRYKAAREFLNGTEQAHGSSAALKLLDTVRDEMPAEQYTALRDHFANRAKQQEAQDRETEQFTLFKRVRETIDTGGDPSRMLSAAVEDKLMTAEQALSWYENYLKEVELRKKRADADAAFRLGDLVSFAQVERSLQQDVADAWAAEQTRAYAEAPTVEDKRQIAGAIVQKGVDMDFVFTGMKTKLRAAPHGPAFAQAVDLYRSLEAFDPYYASKYVSEDQRARFDIYINAVQGGATQEQALDMARTVTPEAVAKTRKLLGSPEGRSTREALQAAMKDKPWSTQEMVNGQQAAAAVLDRATLMLAANPAADIESLVETARTAYENQNVRMGNMWVPRAFLSGVPADRMAGVAGSVTSRLPEVLRANKLPVADGDYVLAPDAASARDSRLQVYDPTGFPVPGLRFGPDDFKAEYRRMQGSEYKKAVEARKSGGVSPDEYKRRTGFYPPGYKTGGAIGDPK